MKSIQAVLLFATILIATPAAAQTVPGYQGDHDSARAQYRAYAIGEFQKVFSGWLEAVQAGDARAAARFYTDDAFVHIGETAQGQGNVLPVLQHWLADVEGVQTGMTDFDASGSMSYASVNLMVDGPGAAGGPGTMLFVLKKVKGGWKIRSHSVVMHHGTGS